MQTAQRLTGWLHGIRYRLSHALRRRSGINARPRAHPVVVSLTSHPPRLSTVFLAVESLLNQSFRPDRIVLWLSTAEIETADLPDTLRRQQKRGLEIRLLDENLSCYKKLIHAIEEFPDCHIVTADDDFMFPRHWLRDLYRAHRRHPNCIAAYRGYWFSRRAARELRPYNLWPPADNATEPSFDIFPTCGAGAWFPPHALNARVTERQLFMRLAPDADDIWYKAHALLARTPTLMARPRSVTFPMIFARGSQDATLWQTNERANDAHLKAVFTHFDLYSTLSRADARGDPARLYRRAGRRRKRLFDIGLALVCLPLLSVPMLLIAALLKATSRDRVLYWSKRVGKGGVIFNMPKFRTLKPIATVSAVATAAPVDRTAHANAAREYESFGKFLRYTSLDELPQLFSILKGDMSFVGPRPIEPVEAGLIALRAEREVDSLAPGLTGWAQVNGRDLLSDAEKVDFDMQYLSRRSLWLDIKILFITAAQVIRRKNISF